MDVWRLSSRRLTASMLAGLVVVGGCSIGGAENAAHGKSSKPKAPPVSFTVTPTVSGNGMSPNSPVVVHAAHGTLDSVQLKGPGTEQVQGDLSPDRTVWTARDQLGYGKKYTLTTTGQNADHKSATKNTTFTTVKPANLTAATLFPGNGVESVGVGQPISLTFDEEVADKAAAQRALKVETTPAVEGSWNWLSSKEVRWRPKDYWKPGTKVTVAANIYGANLGNNLYGEQNVTSSFTIHDAWVAVGNVNTHRLVIYHNDQQVEDFPASFGRPAYPTHDGIHIVQEKYELLMMNSASWGLPANSPDGYSNFPAYWSTRMSNGGEFVHANDGTTYAQGVDNVSHGCVNLTTERARWFYDHFGYGDVVKVIGGSPMLPQDDGFGDWNIPYDKYREGSALR